jgi:adenylate kinase family enzyme
MENGVTAAKEILKKLKQSKSKTLPSKLVESIRSEVETELKDTLLSPMRNIEEQQKLVKKIQRIISDLQLEVQSFTEKTELAEVRELQKPVPVIDLDEFLWQSIAARFIKQEALKELDPEGRKLDVFIAEMSEEVAEAIQIVDVNLMAAIDSKDQNEEEQSPLEIAVSGLERAINLFEQSIQLVRERQNEYEKSVKEKLPNTLNRLADLMLTKDYDRFELQDKALQAKETALNWRDKFDMLSETVLEKIQLGFRFLTSKLKKANKSAAKYLGFSDDDDAINKTVKRNLTEYLSRFNIDNPLPYVYKRLFDREFEIDQRFFINPEQSFQLFEKSYQDWKKEMDVSVIIIGEKGSGKTTLIRFLRDQFLMDGKMISIDFDKTYFSENELMKRLNKAFGYDEDLTRSEFIEKVENKKSRTVVVIENLNNAYVRNINGFGALESFWVIMASTRDKVFWVTTSTRYAWNFFKKMSGADQYYTHIIEVDNLDEERIKNAILTRHKSTGYSLEFKPDKGIESSRTYRKLLNDQQKSQDFLKDQYFEQLAKVAEGNISIAMIFWMQSVVDFDENTFTIQPLKIADVDMLEVPSREVLFTLAALVIHDTLTSEQMALALHQDVSDSRLMLTRLKSKGILKQDEQGYRLNHLVFRQVVRLLKRKNILH